MKTLVIVESPAKCKKIESYLGKDYKCVASFGHFRQLASLKDINDKYDICFEDIEEKKKHIQNIKKEVEKASSVILATDDDREGEGIAWHICDAFGLDVATTPRIVFQEITKPAIKKAVSNPKKVDMDLVNAQQTRQIVDMALGFKISPLLWSAISRKSKTGLSAGRCQTPALKLVFENNKLVANNPGSLSYSTTGYFTSKNIPFELSKHHIEKESMESFLEESVNHQHILNCSEPSDITRNPPVPLITSSLQQQSSNILGYSPKETMALCQKLYENGLITYMRTDSPVLSKDFITTALEFISNRYGENYPNKTLLESDETTEKNNKENNSNDPGGAQEAHEAIRPTDVTILSVPETLGNKEKRMYSFIRNHTLKCCMVAAKMRKLVASIVGPEKANYKYTSQAVTFAGFLIVEGVEDDPYYSYFSSCKKNMYLDYNKITSKCTLKNTKSRVNEAKLVQLLEERGIGRPSTFSSIVDKIQTRGYVKKKNVDGIKREVVNFVLTNDTIEETNETNVFGAEKNRLVVEPLGEIVIEFLEKHFDDILNYEYTKDMELMLDLIAKGNKTKISICSKYYEDIEKQVKKYKDGSNSKVSYRFDDNNEFIIGAHGPVIKCTIGEEVSWKKVKSGITLEQLRKEKCSLEDVVDTENGDRMLGNYKDKEVVLKNGRYGPYVVYENKTISMKDVDKSYSRITIADVIDRLDQEGSDKNPSGNILRVVTPSISVRKGKFGNYIFYKTTQMKKPKFIKIGELKETFMSCSKEIIIKLVEDS